jgi:putative membrane protein
MGWLLGLLLSWALFAVVLMIVDKLNLGLAVGNFTNALIAAAVIAIVAWLCLWVLGLLGITLEMTGLLGAIVAIIAAAIVLLLAGRFFKGMTVSGFGGAIVAAIGIGVVSWLIAWLLGLFGITVTLPGM